MEREQDALRHKSPEHDYLGPKQPWRGSRALNRDYPGELARRGEDDGLIDLSQPFQRSRLLSELGIMHESRNGLSAFVFDMMELERPIIDRRTLNFVKGHKFHAADFIVRADGLCRLNPAMAKRVAEVFLIGVFSL